MLGIAAYPVNWPLGDGPEFRGLFDRQANLVHFFERVPGGQFRAPVSVHGLADPTVKDTMVPEAYARMVEELAMLDGAGAAQSQTVSDTGTTCVWLPALIVSEAVYAPAGVLSGIRTVTQTG